jgi:hypothetical protein
MAWEAERISRSGGDARRLLLSRLVLEHRLSPVDPLALHEPVWESRATDLLLDDARVAFEEACRLVVA